MKNAGENIVPRNKDEIINLEIPIINPVLNPKNIIPEIIKIFPKPNRNHGIGRGNAVSIILKIEARIIKTAIIKSSLYLIGCCVNWWFFLTFNC